MIAMINGETKRVPLAEVSGKLKTVDPDCQMIQEAKPVELKCHFCNSAYEFSTEDLKELLRKSK